MARIGSNLAIEQLPHSLYKLTTWERFHLYNHNEFQVQSWGASFDRRYFPQNCDAIPLPCYWIGRKHLYVYGCHPDCVNSLPSYLFDRSADRVLFPIHPLSLPHYKEFLASTGASEARQGNLRLLAVPTSSTRTLLAWPQDSPVDAVFVKTTIFPDRQLPAKKIAYSVGITKLVQESMACLPDGLLYFPESLGCAPRGRPDCGIIVRSIPKEIIQNHISVAPLFSLLGGSAARPPLFLTMIRERGLHARQFLEEILCAKFSRIWLDAVMRLGLIPECHGQNLLLALSADDIPTGNFYYRDFSGLLVDWELRRGLRLLDPAEMPYAWSWYEAYGSLAAGTPYVELIWWKWWMSLYAYLHFVLNDFNDHLQKWHRRKQIGGRRFQNDELTMMFSHHLIAAIEEKFSTQVRMKSNIYRSLNSFLLSLFKLRKLTLSGNN